MKPLNHFRLLAASACWVAALSPALFALDPSIVPSRVGAPAPMATSSVAVPAEKPEPVVLSAVHADNQEPAFLNAMEVSAEGDSAGCYCSSCGEDQEARLELEVIQLSAGFMIDPPRHELRLFVDPEFDAPRTAGAIRLNGLPISTVVDPATIYAMTLRPAGAAFLDIEQQRHPWHPQLELVARFGEGGRRAGSFGMATGRLRNGNSLFTIVQAEKREHTQLGGMVEAERIGGGKTLQAGVQWRDLAGYGQMHLLRAGYTQALGDASTFKADVAWHDLRREDARQFRLGARNFQYEGLGAAALDLLTAETRRVQDRIAQVQVSGEAFERHGWSTTLRWQAQESAWLTPGVDRTVAPRRDTVGVAFDDKISAAHGQWRMNLHGGADWHRTPGATAENEVTTDLSVSGAHDLPGDVELMGAWYRRESLPWVAMGRWQAEGETRRAVAAPVEVRAGGQVGLSGDFRELRLTATVGAFHEKISGQTYRAWAWEQEQAQTGMEEPVATTEGWRAAVSRNEAADFAQTGFTGALGWSVGRHFSASASWNLGLKDQGPYRGGRSQAQATVRWERSVLGGGVRMVAGLTLNYRDALVFDDGYALHGGVRSDAMLAGIFEWGYRRETKVQLNLTNLADRSWQLTRFAPDRGREMTFSVTQSF